MITEASPLHDVGKIAISDTILLKPGKLTKEEFELMKMHTTKGYDIIMKIFDDEDKKYKMYCSSIARYHHEKYDGRGYPEGIAGDDIPICAQIVSLADAYDALLSKRCYKDAYSYDTAFDMIMNGECGAYNPKLLACFKSVKSELEKHADRLHD
jgi:putative two-component system response regulator